jgi:cell division septation protein DedD/nucleoid DNA-binding protein
MITKNEIIKVISEKAGIAQNDARIFLDVFLSRLSEKMNPGEIFRFGEYGYFHRKTGKLKTVQKDSFEENVQAEASGEKSPNVEMILFSTKEIIGDDLQDAHLFSAHKTLKSDSSEEDLESYFSLSLGKPLISDEQLNADYAGLPGVKNNSLPMSSLMSKADILISTLQLIDKKDSPEFYINAGQKFSDEEFKSFTRQDQPSLGIEQRDSTSTGSDDIMNSAFDTNKMRDSQKNRLPDVSAGQTDGVSGMRSLPWDFGRISFDRKVEYIREETKPGTTENFVAQTKEVNKEELAVETDSHKKDESVKLTEDVIDEIITDHKVFDEIIKNEKEEIEKTGSYIRVRSFISEGLKDKKKPDPFILPESKKEAPPVKKSEELKTGEEFVEVKAKSETYQLKKDIRKEELRKNDVSHKDLYERKTDRYRNDKRRRSFLPFLIFAALVILIFGFIYVYLEYGTLFSSEPEDITYSVKRPDHVKVIERENEVAVTFPYPKPDQYSGITGINQLVFAGIGENTPEQKVIKESSSEENNFKTKPTTDVTNKPEQTKKETLVSTGNEQKNKNNSSKNFGSVGGNVYKYKDYYVVQVASYPTYEVAEEEAKRFKDKGYNAFIEIADIPGKGTWYRVRVGDFTSLKQAEDFAVKNSIQ